MEKILNMHNNDSHKFPLINRYRIERELSYKTGRRTFLAQDIDSQALVIIKILPFDSFFQWDDLKLFEREANTLKNLDHPAIPKYLDYFEVNEENFQGFALVQTYIEAPSLEAAMKEGRKFSEGELIELAEKLLEILIYLHTQIPPVIHRDIKPSNILISNRSGNSVGDVYLVDFGSVQTVANKDNGTITIVGSYGYIPLEQFGGQTTTASDLYSLGMTLIYLITGVHPAELPQVNGQVKFSSPGISSKFARWLEKMTHPHLDKRFNSAKSAKTSLTSKDGSSGDYLHLRPANSQVKLYRDRHKLEIVYEDGDYSLPNLDLGCFFFICLLIFVQISIISWIFLLLCIGSLIGLFSVMFNLFASFNKCYKIISIERDGEIKLGSYYGKLELATWRSECEVQSFSTKEWGMAASRNQEELEFLSLREWITQTSENQKFLERSASQKSLYRKSEKLDNISWSKQSSHFKNIDLLAYNPGYTFNKYRDQTGRVVRGGAVKINPKLSIHAGHLEYPIGNQKLSQAELWWLGQELSDFLGLELQVIYPTPKVPSQQSCAACGGC